MGTGGEKNEVAGITAEEKSRSTVEAEKDRRWRSVVPMGLWPCECGSVPHADNKDISAFTVSEIA